MSEQAGAIVLASDSAAVIQQHQKQEHEGGYNIYLMLVSRGWQHLYDWACTGWEYVFFLCNQIISVCCHLECCGVL